MNQGKTRVWNRCGDRPPNCEHLFNTDGEPNDASRGDHDLPTDRQGVRILGTPLGHAHFVQAELAKKIGEHGTLLERIRNYLLRVVHPALSLNFAVQHDAGIRQCLEDLLHTPVTSEMWEMASLPFSTGGVGFAECSANQIHSILGKLGRRRPNDSLASRRSCGSHRVVSVQRSGRFSSGRRL